VALMKPGGWASSGKDPQVVTPLLWAVIHNKARVSKLLPGSGDVDPNISDSEGRTPLFLASAGGPDGLLTSSEASRDGEVNINLSDNENQTLLWQAVCHGYESIARLPFERNDVCPNLFDTWGQTPLWQAAVQEHDGIAKLFIERNDVNPNLYNNDGQHRCGRRLVRGTRL